MPATTSRTFESIRTLEVDGCGDDSVTVRVELLRRVGDAGLYRCRVWRLESYRIQPTFPQTAGAPAHLPSDEEVLVSWTHALPADLADGYRCSSDDEALTRALTAIEVLR